MLYVKQDIGGLHEVETEKGEGGGVLAEEVQLLTNMNYMTAYWRCISSYGFVCAAKQGLQPPTSLYPSAAEGLSGGAGRRQLRDQGLLIFGGSRGPRLMALRLPR